MIETRRINLQMSSKIVDYYQNMANEMGVSRAYCMVMALKVYMDQQETIKIAGNFDNFIKQVKELNGDE